ncbi:LacI family DNA-binding transcriptional regulator [Pseudactinotalea suaedae]|uniref:LacI family DNA-binding transcriptional regulator n=1 Tax=Pseudactinotalea suaedae TaxID=1524924 RepID=UPI0012E227F4|nr:LacI family DNA-binding transcriptional regulator [Pseudactinotalea suaedae]
MRNDGIGARRATIKEVAEAAGVSRSTASRALSGTGYVAENVRSRVRLAAEELGYVVDATARSLKQQSSRLIGVVVSDLRNAFYSALAAGAARACRSAGYTMVLLDDWGHEDDETSAAETFVALRVAGVVATPVTATLSRYLVRHRIPVIEADRRFSEDTVSAVVVDNRAAARATTEHLLALGHRRIALLLDETEWTTGNDRREGYTDALRAGGHAIDPRLVVPTGWDAEAARQAATELLQRPDPPTAVFAANNLLAEGAWRAAADLGIAVPDRLSLVAFDDASWMSMVSPGVTAVVQDPEAIGALAVGALIDELRGEQEAPRTVVVPTRMIRRGSTAIPALLDTRAGASA